MKIASFNAQRFGVAKLANPYVLSTLVKVKIFPLIISMSFIRQLGPLIKHYMVRGNYCFCELMVPAEFMETLNSERI